MENSSFFLAMCLAGETLGGRESQINKTGLGSGGLQALRTTDEVRTREEQDSHDVPDRTEESKHKCFLFQNLTEYRVGELWGVYSLFQSSISEMPST